MSSLADSRVVPGPAPRGVSSHGRAAGWNILFFLAGLVLFETGINHFSSPFQGADKVERKFAYFAAHKDEYDLVFVGSSRVLNQLSPKTFDSQMASAGRPCRSFNLGFAGMFLPECSFLIDQVRALHPSRLRAMVVELSNPAPRHDAEHPLTERDIYWHHFAPTLLAVSAVWTDPDSLATSWERTVQVWLQAATFTRCIVHLGYGPQIITDLRKSTALRTEPRETEREVIGPAADGFFPLLHTLGQSQTHAAKTGGSTLDLMAFRKMVERLRARDAVGARVPAAGFRPAVSRGAQVILRNVLSRQLADMDPQRHQTFAVHWPGHDPRTGFPRSACRRNITDVVRLQRSRRASRPLCD